MCFLYFDIVFPFHLCHGKGIHRETVFLFLVVVAPGKQWVGWETVEVFIVVSCM